MFEKIGRLAEGLVTDVSASRRGFLGRVGKSALGVAAALGALAVSSSAQSGGVVCCEYSCLGGSKRYHPKVCLPAGSTCSSRIPGGYGSCYLVHETKKSDCSKC
jgi:hypothetical protein